MQIKKVLLIKRTLGYEISSELKKGNITAEQAFWNLFCTLHIDNAEEIEAEETALLERYPTTAQRSASNA